MNFKELFKFKFKKTNNQEKEQEFSDSLKFLEEVLQEEDPTFVQELSSLKNSHELTDASEAVVLETMNAVKKKNEEESFLDRVIEKKVSKKKWTYQVYTVLKQPFLFKTHPKKALGFWIVFIGIGVGYKLAFKAHYWTHESTLFLTSYAALGVPVEDYDMINEVESFFENSHFVKNVMSFSRLVVNIKPSEESGPNPMVAFDVVIEALSSDAIVEVKDREAEFKDLILREAEEFTYDQLGETEGKTQLAKILLSKINANLTKSQIRKVYYNNFILKN